MDKWCRFYPEYHCAALQKFQAEAGAQGPATPAPL